MKRRILTILVCGVILIFGIWFSKQETDHILPHRAYSELSLIAHAGGGLQFGLYSNSLEALDQSASVGFEFIEVDFMPTVNGDLVLIHDWGKRYRQYFGVKTIASGEPESADIFKRMKMRHDLTPLSLGDLLEWMRVNPNIRIITDIKTHNVKHLKHLHSKADDLAPRFIPQIYQVSEYEAVRQIGFEDIIFTNYRAQIDNQNLINLAQSHDLFALTLPLETPHLTQVTRELSADTPVFVHKLLSKTPVETVNTPQGATRLKEQGVQGIFTDYLTPAELP